MMRIGQNPARPFFLMGPGTIVTIVPRRKPSITKHPMSKRVVEYALWLGVGSFFACSTSTTQPTDDGGAILDVSSEATIDNAVMDLSVDLVACNRPPPPPEHECIGCPGERPGGNCVLPQPDGGLYGRCREEVELI